MPKEIIRTRWQSRWLVKLGRWLRNSMWPAAGSRTGSEPATSNSELERRVQSPEFKAMVERKAAFLKEVLEYHIVTGLPMDVCAEHIAFKKSPTYNDLQEQMQAAIEQARKTSKLSPFVEGIVRSGF